MVNLKKVLSLSLVSAMTLSIAGCSGNGGSDAKTTTAGNNSNDPTSSNEGPTAAPNVEVPDKTRVINIGTWYEHYYTSEHHEIDDQPKVTDRENAQMNLDNMRNIEQTYNVELYFKNLTWDGVISSINTSIMAGTPDMDVYETDLQFGVPAVMNGYAQAISSYADPDDDIYKDQIIVEPLQIDGLDDDYLFTGSSDLPVGLYALGFNMDMIKDANLENPQDLYDRGEWTWDKFLEYLQALTKDTDNDGKTDVYGYGGWWTTFLTYMLLSNGTDIASSPTSHLDSAATIETIQFIDDMYNKYQVARPWNEEDWNINNDAYASGEMAFWITACWIADGMGDADPSKVSFECGVVPFPKGPNVTKNGATYKSYNTSSNYYFIPKGIDDSKLVYKVVEQWINWFDGDVSLRDDSQWWEGSVYSPNAENPERNYTYLVAAKKNATLDNWGNLDTGFSIVPIITGQTTTAQYIEENKQILQDALDTIFDK